MGRRVARLLCQAVGWSLVVLALLAGGSELANSIQSGGWEPYRLGEAWASIDLASLNLMQAVIQRHLHPAIWDPGIITFLLLPAWLVAVVPAAVLLVVCRRRAARRRAFEGS